LPGTAGNGSTPAPAYIMVADQRLLHDTEPFPRLTCLKEAPMFEQYQPQLARMWRVGYAADPAIDILLDKSRIAQIKVRQLEMVIQELQAQIDIAKLELNLLREEYKIKARG
jgi:hypothetical protein